MSPFSVESHLRESARVKLALSPDSIEHLGQALISVARRGGTIFACGNGGSTCDAMHLVEELVARYKRERPGIRAQHLCDPATITCWSNDYSFETVFERQVETFISDRDALVVFSTSGNSPNVIRAVQAAQKRHAAVLALLGKGGGRVRELVPDSLVVDSDSTAHIQEAHIAVVHILCDLLESALFGE